MSLPKKQEEALAFLKSHDGVCDWNEPGLTVEISENLVDLAWQEYVESHYESETWTLKDKGENYVA